jgi:hypothetical protein
MSTRPRSRVKIKSCGAVEHPRWRRQTSPFLVRCRTAQKHWHVAALDDFVNMHLAAKPGMPWITNFPYLSPMDVVLLRCTIEKECIRPWATRAQWRSRKIGVASRRRRRHDAGAMGGPVRRQGQPVDGCRKRPAPDREDAAGAGVTPATSLPSSPCAGQRCPSDQVQIVIR